MADRNLEMQLAQLQQLYEQGLLSEANYRAALAGLGVEPAATFDLRGQRFEQQVNVAGDFIDRRQMVVEPGASPQALQRRGQRRTATLRRLHRAAHPAPGDSGD